MDRNQNRVVRDISWLSFNERVLQEAMDEHNHILDRIRFLGIFSNNQDEFFRVRVAALRRMVKIEKNSRAQFEENPELTLKRIQKAVIQQSAVFDEVYEDIISQLSSKYRIYMKNEQEINEEQQRFILNYFDEKVRTRIVPLMIEGMEQLPHLSDKSIYLACILESNTNPLQMDYALIEVPSDLPRFVLLPSENSSDIILLEDIIRFNLYKIFSIFNYNQFSAYIIKVTRDAEFDIDNDISLNLIEELKKAIKNRKRGKATRFIYDKDINPIFLNYLIKRLNLTKRDNLISGGRIHNFKDFMNFPSSIFDDWVSPRQSFIHQDLKQPCRILEVLDQKDVLLNFPYHSFDSIIDLLREAAIDPQVQSIKITGYRLAKDSKIINALINAVRNGKKITVVLELRARFDETANLNWKSLLEDEGVKVIVGLPHMKVHAKICVIKKKTYANKTKRYGFISTGNFNENTATYYTDFCLLTSNKNLLNEVNKVFHFLEYPNNPEHKISLEHAEQLFISPFHMRSNFIRLIENEIEAAKNNKKASIFIKLNSLVGDRMIHKLYEAAEAGVEIRMIIRGVCCVIPDQPHFKKSIKAISIVDNFLEHGRAFVFHNQGDERVFISSADWMIRNLDYRIEVACPILNPEQKQELIHILESQWSENVKARILDNDSQNKYVIKGDDEVEWRSQKEIYKYLLGKSVNSGEKANFTNIK